MEEGETPSGYRRRKAPEQVRAALLNEAAAIAIELGIAGLTLQAVARAAGVTKGGLLHHFPSKDALIDALIGATFAAYDAALIAMMAEDPVPRGRFTRAYIRACLPDTGASAQIAHAEGEAAPPPSLHLMAALWTDPRLRKEWYERMAALEARHAETDAEPALKLLRFAADGIWIAATDGQDPSPWVETLLAKSLS